MAMIGPVGCQCSGGVGVTAFAVTTYTALNSDLLSSWQPRMDLKNPLPLVVADQLTAWLDSKASWVYRGLQPVHSYQLHDALSSPESYRSADFNLRVYRELVDKQVVVGVYGHEKPPFQVKDIVDVLETDLDRLPPFEADGWLRLDGAGL